jgi:energy-converting hydrogenase Eha subunit H
VTNEATNVKTGDTFNMYLWIALFVIATVTIITTVTILIRNNTKNKSNEQEN